MRLRRFGAPMKISYYKRSDTKLRMYHDEVVIKDYPINKKTRLATMVRASNSRRCLNFQNLPSDYQHLAPHKINMVYIKTTPELRPP